MKQLVPNDNVIIRYAFNRAANPKTKRFWYIMRIIHYNTIFIP